MNLGVLRKLNGVTKKVDHDLFEAISILVNDIILDFSKNLDCYSVSL